MTNLKVVLLSNWFDNPYKSLLISSLQTQGIEVEIYRVSMIFLPQVLKKGKPDIVHFHALPIPVIWRKPIAQFAKLCLFRVQVAILHLLDTKIVWTAHEWHDKIGFRNFCNTLPLFAKLFDNSIDAIISHCQTNQQEILTTWQIKNKHKVFVLPLGNYIDWYQNKIEPLEARKTLGIPEKNIVFLLFGNIYRYKGVLQAIDAFKALQTAGISLLIAGSVKEEDLEKLIKDKIQGYKNILFVPQRIPDDEVQIYMNTCDCVVVPYQVFTTSAVAVLAMSFRRACIAPQVGFFNDTLDDSGSFLYDSSDEKGLLQAMEWAIENRARLADMGKHNLQLAQQWNWKYVAEETCKIYQWCFEQ